MTTDSNNDLSAPPRYRVIADAVVVNGFIEPIGHEFETRGWPPRRGVEARNEPARRILSWMAENMFDAWVPETLWNSEYDRFYLPGRSRDTRGAVIPIVPPEKIAGKMPAYRAVKSILRDPWGQSIFSRDIHAGEEIVTLDWPRWPEGSFEPINTSAEKVLRYYVDAAGHPKLLPSPWNSYSQSVFLPALPVARDGWTATEYAAVAEAA